MTRFAVGIDPGITGAVAAIGLVNGRPQLWHIDDIPTTKTNNRSMVSAALFRATLQEIESQWGKPVAVGVELVSARPKQGVTSSFRFGQSLGIVQGVIAGMGWPMLDVNPRKWKMDYALNGKDKDEARTLAINLFPDQAAFFRRKKDQGRADATLIACHVAANL